MQQHMAFHDLVATAVLEQDREAAVHALMIDPLTAAVCSLEEIRQMFDEMAEAQRRLSAAIYQPLTGCLLRSRYVMSEHNLKIKLNSIASETLAPLVAGVLGVDPVKVITGNMKRLRRHRAVF